MRQLNSLFRSVANRALHHRSSKSGVLDSVVARPGASRPLHIATSVAILANHRRGAISVVDARDEIQHLAMTRFRTRAERQLIDDLVSATGLELIELAEVTKEWLPW